MAKGGFYAVAAGRSPGIFTSWAEAEAQIKGFPGARFKKFPSQAEAQTFIDRFNGVTPSSTTTFQSVAVATTPKRSREDAVDDDIQPPLQRAKQSKFYAVTKGHSTGVATSTEQLTQLTEGFPGRAVYKEFNTEEAAAAYLTGFQSGQKEALSPKIEGSAKSLQTNVQTTVTDSTESAKTEDQLRKKTTHKAEFWYAVAKGHKTGVFRTWNEAKKQVEGMHSAKFKKFPTQKEAQAFVDKHKAATQILASDPDPKDPNTLVAFCDGSALQNGRRGCQAGYACIFPHRTEWNVATKLVEDSATNNRAEYLAGLEALKRANIEDPGGAQVLYIFSDSMLLIRSMTEWVGTWQKKGWKKSDGAAVMNRDLLELLVKEKGSRRVLWRHVKAHTGKQDWKSKWNDVADNAARDAAMSC
ncbi:RNA-DNA hybrid ribonuclease [Phytophthora boehmeriae]|uniref:ribonuclease H n=1 Tax=Phytophthora boehmeriae TaxID=109152 RepID=A0A8T1WDF9_9STRA|nr:RNA-DNA hybrid ribonuclease [Phytophthora boehmeriae]